jgi:hypothetical protein
VQGLVFVVVVAFVPGGIVGLVRLIRASLSRRGSTDQVPAPDGMVATR